MLLVFLSLNSFMFLALAFCCVEVLDRVLTPLEFVGAQQSALLEWEGKKSKLFQKIKMESTNKLTTNEFINLVSLAQIMLNIKDIYAHA